MQAKPESKAASCLQGCAWAHSTARGENVGQHRTLGTLSPAGFLYAQPFFSSYITHLRRLRLRTLAPATPESEILLTPRPRLYLLSEQDSDVNASDQTKRHPQRAPLFLRASPVLTSTPWSLGFLLPSPPPPPAPRAGDVLGLPQQAELYHRATPVPTLG